MTYLPIFFMTAALALGKWDGCHSVFAVTQKGMGKYMVLIYAVYLVWSKFDVRYVR